VGVNLAGKALEKSNFALFDTDSRSPVAIGQPSSLQERLHRVTRIEADRLREIDQYLGGRSS
jgi:hypothetical protein